MYPPGYYRNGFMETHALMHMIHGYILSIRMNQRLLIKLSKERNICLYILNMIWYIYISYVYIYLYIYINIYILIYVYIYIYIYIFLFRFCVYCLQILSLSFSCPANYSKIFLMKTSKDNYIYKIWKFAIDIWIRDKWFVPIFG